MSSPRHSRSSFCSNIKKTTAACLLLFLSVTTAGADEKETPVPDDQIVMTFSVKGVNGLSDDLTKSVTQLAEVLHTIQTAGVNLPKEDLESLEALLKTTNVLVTSVGDNSDKISAALKNAKDPALELTNAVMQETEKKFITPAIAEFNQSIRHALWGALLIGVLLASAFGLIVWLALKRMLPVLIGMQKLIDGHVIVPREQWVSAGAVKLLQEQEEPKRSEEPEEPKELAKTPIQKSPSDSKAHKP